MKIVCVGFYGHGNAGDEAIARSLDRYLRRPFHNVELLFSTEMSSDLAAKVNEKNPFYADRNIISVYDMETIKQKVRAVAGIYGVVAVLIAVFGFGLGWL